MSNVDPKGVQPGLAPQAKPEEKIINLRCRNTGRCDSMTAKEIRIGNHNKNGGQRIYRCTECGHSWGINTGGNLNLP